MRLEDLLEYVVVGHGRGGLYWARKRCFYDWFNRLGPVRVQCPQ